MVCFFASHDADFVKVMWILHAFEIKTRAYNMFYCCHLKSIEGIATESELYKCSTS